MSKQAVDISEQKDSRRVKVSVSGAIWQNTVDGDLFMLRLLRMIFYHNIQTDCYRSQNPSWRKGGEIALIKA